MKHVKLFEEFLNEKHISPDTIFKRKATADSYLDILDYWREHIGFDNENNKEMKSKAFKNAKVEIVDINKIIPNQDYLKPKTIKKYQDSKNHEPAEVVKIGQDYILFDGHHRIAVAILNGETKVKLKVLN